MNKLPLTDENLILIEKPKSNPDITLFAPGKIKLTKKEIKLIEWIAYRYMGIRILQSPIFLDNYGSFESLVSDLSRYHKNDTQLDLRKLFFADDATLIHDILGIQAFCYRRWRGYTSKQENRFVPRCALSESEQKEGGVA